MSIISKNYTNNIIFITLLIVILILLAGYGIAGWQSRYLADDYCYDAQFNQYGFFQGQVDSYLNPMPYSSNRYSLTLFSGLAWLLGGVKIMPLLPGAAIVIWSLVLIYSIDQGLKHFQIQQPTFIVAFTATVIVFYTLLLATNQYQNLFWRSGMLTYLVPLVFNVLLIGQFFNALRSKQQAIIKFLGLVILSWVAAGFSEIVFAIQAGFWGLALLGSLWFRRAPAVKAAIAILIGTLMGFFLLVFNPTNALRQSPFHSPAPLWTVIITALQFAKDFFFDSVRGMWLPLLMLLGTGAALGWLVFPPRRFRFRSGLILLLGLAIGTYLLLVCNMAPTIWAMSAYPDQRGLLPGTFVLCLFFFSAGVWFGSAGSSLAQNFISPHIKAATSFLLLFVLSGYLLHFIPSTYGLIDAYRARAMDWDARNEQIIASRSAGQSHIVVAGIDSIAQIFELQPNEDHWVNRCAARYYQVESIKSTESINSGGN